MTNLPEKEQIRQAVIDFRTQKSLSQPQLATLCSVSAALISQLENRKWDNISTETLRKIWLKVSSAGAKALFTTSDFTTCQKACESAIKSRFMVGLLADTGMGKTTALKAFARRKNVFYVLCEKSQKPRQFFISLLREMGISFEGSIYEMVCRVADEINILDKPLIIIDEAGKITHTLMLYLHDLRNRTDENGGIVLAGMPYFKSNLEKYRNKQKEGCSEFLRRINLWQELQGLSKKEVEYICHESGITNTEIIKSMYGKKRFGDLYNAILLHNLENE